MKKEINGKTIEYGDCIFTTITTHFSVWDRIKILFGKPIINRIEIYCGVDDVKVLHTESTPSIPPFTTRKPKYTGAGEAWAAAAN